MKKMLITLLAIVFAATIGTTPAKLDAETVKRESDPTLIESYPSVNGDTMYFAVKNNTGEQVVLEDLTVELRTDDGEVVATTIAKGYPEELDNGEVGHYMVTFDDLDATEGVFTNINKVVSRKEADTEAPKLEILGHTVEGDKIVGEVINATNEPVKAEIYAVCNDPMTGAFVGIACKEISFKAGESVKFEIPAADMINENGLAYRLYIRYLD